MWDLQRAEGPCFEIVPSIGLPWADRFELNEIRSAEDTGKQCRHGLLVSLQTTLHRGSPKGVHCPMFFNSSSLSPGSQE